MGSLSQSAAPNTPAPTPPVNTAKDVGLSVASGVPRGIANTLMFPIDLSRSVEGVGNWAYNKVENGVRSLIGADPLSAQELARRDAGIRLPWEQAVSDTSPAYTVEDYIRGKMNDNLHKPETRLGRVAGTVTEFAVPGSIMGKAGAVGTTGREIVKNGVENFVGNALIPGVASEVAGQATEGTPYEGLARFIGALGGNLATAAGRSYNAPESVVRRATGEMTDADWQRALDLQNNTTGIKLSGPESIAQAKGGASALPNVQRVVEGSVEGRAGTAPFYAQRPGQVDTAVGNVLDQIAPQSAQPSTLGPRAAEVAGDVIDNTRQGINAQTRPLYQAAETQALPQAQFAPIAADPRFQAGLARLRGNAELAPEYAHLPDNSIGVIDAVTKDLNARGEALANAANPLYGPELAGRSRTAAADARNAASTASPEYAQALAEQEALRRTQLNPLEQGPVGRVAAATDTAGAGNAILPQNPLTGSAGEAADATRRLAAEDPATTSGLVRQNLADRYTKATTETQGANSERAGIKFHQDVAGNDTRQQVLDAVLRQLPGGQATADRMGELLDVLQATGHRQAVGSATAFNHALNEALGSASPAAALYGLARSLGTSFVTRAGDAVRRRSLQGNITTLADMFTDPHSVELIREAIARGPENTIPNAAMRSALESGGTIFDPAGKR
ncbi:MULTISPECIES: hypothetical protein [unclassified Mesorhizobium]|uniref:hypothetical protein n=1 Tax=unclassified Mesorhizobium TaxID=325217 RepID=UPI000FDB45A8|nr:MULTISPECIES: hypothetical protein [unclassified Mesorhizobium]TGT76138.1 hypothetical protein EN809_000495 [Mesorhizobium sp. M2E.F.Ca.ET.166.01.1.1]TGW02253.1 hypothetical protein EN797_000495 [Mesorhizobium sp. M2E.F.Ca.ET.154.01.1.1]